MDMIAKKMKPRNHRNQQDKRLLLMISVLDFSQNVDSRVTNALSAENSKLRSQTTVRENICNFKYH